jgi:phosphohistidine phosphatase
MKKKLLLVRHAKAKSGDFEIKDFDRPLSQKGIDEALEMGQQLFQGNIFPDGIISSPALRAISTAKSISISLGF